MIDQNESVTTLSPIQPEESRRTKQALYWILGVFFILLIAIGGVYVYQKYFLGVDLGPEAFVDLKGDVYLTLASVEGNTNGGYADVYTFDIENEEFGRTAEDGFVKVTSALSPSGKRLAYAASPYDPEKAEGAPFSELLQLYVRNFDTGTVEKITNATTSAVRMPRWSPDGNLIAFTSIENYADAADNDPNKWLVHVTDLEGNIETIGVGTYPLWSPDGENILFVRSEGLYLYNVQHKTEHLALPLDEELTTFMKFGLSSDGSLLAWSYPQGGTLTVFRISSWEPFSVIIEDEIWTGVSPAYWPVFSSNNRYLIFQEVDWDSQTGEFSNLRLTAYDREIKSRKTLADLTQYRFDASFINDWR